MASAIIEKEYCDYAMIILYPEEVVIHYVSGFEMALSYLFKTQEEADKAYRYCVDLVGQFQCLPYSKQEEAHRNWVNTYMAKNGSPTLVY